MTSTPDAEVDVDEALVRSLLEAQHPDLAGLAIEPLDAGWDNAMFRVGDALLARLPRRAVAVGNLERELVWLPVLAPTLPVRVPVPVRRGEPGSGYPWPWSLVAWTEGRPADVDALCDDQAERWGALLRALHRPAPAEAPHNPFRGGPLASRREAVEARAATLEAWTPAVEAAWREALEAPLPEGRRWLHGDLHPRNVLVRDGALAAVIDWGDLCGGDPATDLASVWMLFDRAAAREGALAAHGADAATVARARGWAALFGSILAGLVDAPYHQRVGLETLRRLSEPPSARR